MSLSNRLTFSIFSVLLITALALIVAPAMAQQTITYYATGTKGADANTDGKWEVTFKFSEGGSFAKSHFTSQTTDATPVTQYNISIATNNLTKEQFDAVTYSGNKLTVPIPKADPPQELTSAGLIFTIQGYDAVPAITANIAEADALPLTVASGYLASRAYRVYSRVASTESNGPVLGTATSVEVPVVEDVTNSAFPADLEEFFNVRGGTIDLILKGTAKNSKHIIINEIMWASDARLRGQDGEFNQQWIEVYNRSVIPVPDSGISFRFIDDTFPAPELTDDGGVSDRLSNIAGHQNVWNLKGSSTGTSTTKGLEDSTISGASVAFSSMFRNIDKQGSDGWIEGHWTTSGRAYFPGFNGTPGEVNVRAGLPGTRPNPSAATPPKDKIIISEVYATNAADEDWIELRNVSNAAVNIKNWKINYTDGMAQTEHDLFQFADKDTNIGPGEVLLIVNKDPQETNLWVGQDIREGDAANQALGAGPHKFLNVKRSDSSGFDIPDTVGFLILRSSGDNKFKASRTHMHDVVGYSRVSINTITSGGSKEPENGSFWRTDAWPINGHWGGNYRAHDAGDSSNGNASLDPAQGIANDHVWARNGTAHGWRKDGGSHAGFVGGIGYDRGVKGNGTPGYPNDVVKGKIDQLGGGTLVITELMLTTDNGKLPQYIELYNNSNVGIDLSSDGSDPKTGWQLIFENHNSGDWSENNRPLTGTIDLKDFGDIKFIPPGETVLIVSRTSRFSGTAGAVHFPSHKVASVWGTANARNAFGMKNVKSMILNAAGGFYLKIVDGDGVVTDEVGNLDGEASNVRKGIGIDDAYSWHWSTEMADDGARTSLIRLKMDAWKGEPRTADEDTGFRMAVPDRTVDGDMTGSVVPLGTPANRRGTMAAWVHAVDTNFGTPNAGASWYGNSGDYGTPGYTGGSPLPVSLSFFRPTLEEGNVVIRWTTESELDNAGFNILRSDSRNGEFTKVNEQMIAGKGTTAERSTYKWVDTTAKPGAVYYYQIEDVSFAGERNTLTTTKLKGLISAKGKLTTQWGELKEVQ